MRKFTDTEEKLVNALIKNASKDTGRRIGDVLMQVYPIEYIEKNTINEPFYKETIKICHKEEKDIESKLYEAFSLIIMLIEKRYIVAKVFSKKKNIGEVYPYCRPIDDYYVERTYFNYHNIDLWELLNSHYSVTNSLIDFAKDFKTIEQRRSDEQICTAWMGIIVAICIGISTPFITQCISEDDEQEKLEHIVNAIKEQKTVTIDSVKALSADTFNVNIIQPKVKPAPKLQQYTTKQPISQN